jgi:SAM-dependent methyltransferase
MEKNLEYIDCDFCGKNKTSLFLEAEYKDTRERFKIVRCDNCGLIYLNPRPAKEEIARYYPPDSYYSYQDFSNRKFNYREWLKKISLEGYYNSKNIFKKLIARFLVPNFMIVVPKERMGRLLDIGCGSGEFLNQMRNFGWEVYGVEINPESAIIGNKKGLTIFCGELESADFPDDYFDVVVLSQCLEHVYSPSSYLREIHRIIRPEGTLIIGVPNIECLESKIFEENWHALEVPRHLYFFSVSSLRRYLEKYGFMVEKVLSKKFSLPLSGLRADLSSFIWNRYKEKNFWGKALTSFQTVLRLNSLKFLKFVFKRDQVKELGVHISIYAKKPSNDV